MSDLYVLCLTCVYCVWLVGIVSDLCFCLFDLCVLSLTGMYCVWLVCIVSDWYALCLACMHCVWLVCIVSDLCIVCLTGMYCVWLICINCDWLVFPSDPSEGPGQWHSSEGSSGLRHSECCTQSKLAWIHTRCVQGHHQGGPHTWHQHSASHCNRRWWREFQQHLFFFLYAWSVFLWKKSEGEVSHHSIFFIYFKKKKTERENLNSNSETLIFKDSSVRSIWTHLTASSC